METISLPKAIENLRVEIDALPKAIYDQQEKVAAKVELLLAAKDELARVRNAILNPRDGIPSPIDGKNAEIREAQLAQLTVPEAAGVRKAEVELRKETQELERLHNRQQATASITSLVTRFGTVIVQ